jgi:hypothetical protein
MIPSTRNGMAACSLVVGKVGLVLLSTCITPRDYSLQSESTLPLAPARSQISPDLLALELTDLSPLNYIQVLGGLGWKGISGFLSFLASTTSISILFNIPPITAPTS